VPEDGDGLVIVATWNVRNFFDDVCDSGRCGPDDYEPALSAPQFAFKTRMVSEGVDALQADVVLLQEVENERAMNALLAAQNGRWPVAVLGETGFAASVDVLVLSRGELLEVRTHRDRPLPQPSGRDTRFAREFLEVHVEIEGQRVIVFNAHFRSKNADDPERRWAEASLAAEILRERRQEFRDALIVLGGDLNDEPGSPTLQNIERSGHYEGIWRELPATDGSYFFGGAPRMIDHLYHCVDCGGRYLEGSATLLGERGQAFQTSDHRPVRAVYRLSGEAP
jgi:endonuclease/exonuclease/phosphatase family metal-dependent hydrolase